MSTQSTSAPNGAASANDSPTIIAKGGGSINLSPQFHLQSVDHELQPGNPPPSDPTTAPVGVLSNFTGTFAGTGFNTIFRPSSGTTKLPNPITPPAPTPPSENILELNLTTEKLQFSEPIGVTPNRGLEAQGDIFLNGVAYVQSINNVANATTGKADGKPLAIHFEDGLWMHVPATTQDPVIGDSLVRMGSIPHGTTINAQSLQNAGTTVSGAPDFTQIKADITPFVIGDPTNKITFMSQTASNASTPRLPQDLSKFIAAGTITQDILDNPNLVLQNANKGKNITSTIIINISTASTDATAPGGGTANISFLTGSTVATANTKGQSGPNAQAVQMTATFWIEKVQHQLVVPPFKLGQAPLKLKPSLPHPGAAVPTFVVHPPHEIISPLTINVTSTQIQYSQNVFLNFAGLTWPHVSVATLIPTGELSVPASVFGN